MSARDPLELPSPRRPTGGGVSGRFSAETMTAAMREIAASLDVSAEGARLLQLTNNAVFALPRPGIVIRIARNHQLLDRATKVVQLGRWFAEVDAPTIRLAPNLNQPVQVGNLAASVWTYIPSQPPVPAAKELGSVLREFHALGPPPFGLPAWDPVGDARRRLADAEGLDPSAHEILGEWCDRLEPKVTLLNQNAEPTLIHGDAHMGNLLRKSANEAVLCDFDATSIGPWQVDLAAIAVAGVRFGGTNNYPTLAAAYGTDITQDSAWSTVREARELKMVAVLAPLATSCGTIAREFTNRLTSIRNDDSRARWVPLVDFAPSKRSRPAV